MQIKEWAEQILYGSSLDEKLVSPSELTDDDFSPAQSPLWPTRSPQISLEKTASKRKTFTDKGFSSDLGRASVFHFFANHELLALELMALALLKFPTATKSMRRGLTGTMKDEQKHLRLYLQRMNHLGLEFGELPLNSFFWRTISPCQTLEQIIASLSLTFEQANLDYAAYYKNEFAKMGDTASEEIMKEVYEDEISHVHFGVQWLGQQKPSHLSLWDYHKELLTWPLTAARAKGTVFDRAAREKAGLDRSYIDALNVFHHTKGKPPVLYIFNMSQDGQGIMKKIEADLATLFLFVAGKNDAILFERQPSEGFLKKIISFGLEIPELFAKNLRDRRTVEKIEFFKPVSDSDYASYLQKLHIESQTPNPVFQMSDSKFAAKEIDEVLHLNEFKDSQKIVTTSDLEELLSRVGTYRLKDDLGTSGHDQLIFTGPSDLKTREKARKLFEKSGQLLAEPNHDRLADFSLLFDTRKKDYRLKLTRQICTPNGTYGGTWNIEPLFFDLSKELERELMHKDKLNFMESLKNSGKLATRQLKEKGYFGPGSIDGYLYRTTEGKLEVRRMCEMNCRWTMGHFLSHMQKHFPKPGVLLLFNKRDLSNSQSKNFTELEQKLTKIFNLVIPCADSALAQVLFPVYLSDPNLLTVTRETDFLNSKCHSLSTQI